MTKCMHTHMRPITTHTHTHDITGSWHTHTHILMITPHTHTHTHTHVTCTHIRDQHTHTCNRHMIFRSTRMSIYSEAHTCPFTQKHTHVHLLRSTHMSIYSEAHTCPFTQKHTHVHLLRSTRMSIYYVINGAAPQEVALCVALRVAPLWRFRMRERNMDSIRSASQGAAIHLLHIACLECGRCFGALQMWGCVCVWFGVCTYACICDIAVLKLCGGDFPSNL